MNVDIQTILSQNIILLYESLDLKSIDIDKLRYLRVEQTGQMGVATERIVVVYPPEPTIVQIGDNRIVVMLQDSTKAVGEIPLWEFASSCHELVPTPKFIAYGFNYDVKVHLPNQDVFAAVAELSTPNVQKVETTLEGELISFSITPRIAFTRKGRLYDLVILPVDNNTVRVGLNVHFEPQPAALPDTTDLAAAFNQEYDALRAMLSRLLSTSVE